MKLCIFNTGSFSEIGLYDDKSYAFCKYFVICNIYDDGRSDYSGNTYSISPGGGLSILNKKYIQKKYFELSKYFSDKFNIINKGDYFEVSINNDKIMNTNLHIDEKIDFMIKNNGSYIINNELISIVKNRSISLYRFKGGKNVDRLIRISKNKEIRSREKIESKTGKITDIKSRLLFKVKN